MNLSVSMHLRSTLSTRLPTPSSQPIPYNLFNVPLFQAILVFNKILLIKIQIKFSLSYDSLVNFVKKKDNHKEPRLKGPNFEKNTRFEVHKNLF